MVSHLTHLEANTRMAMAKEKWKTVNPRLMVGGSVKANYVESQNTMAGGRRG
jgi:hypothetical protein